MDNLRSEQSSKFADSFVGNLIRKESDLPLFSHFAKSSSLLISVIALLALPAYALYLVPAHLLVYLFFVGPTITMFHDINHSPLFKNRLFNDWAIDLYGLMYGITPKTYFAHHVIMHHPENNEYEDLSSTLPFQRDSFRDFANYYLHFIICLFPLSDYLKKSGNKKKARLANIMVFSELSYWLAALVLMYFNPLASLAIFILPVLITRSFLIVGNWGEHAFVDPKEPENLYTSSTNMIGIYNKSHFNVGFHIGHHVKPSLHYSLLEQDFYDNIERYAKADAIVFENLHYPHIWYYLMTKNYKKLAAKFVQLPGTKIRSETEIIAFLKSRLIPVKK